MQEISEKFSPENIKKAYEKIGYTPIQGYWYKPREKRCCPMMALTLAEGMPEDQLIGYYTNFRSLVKTRLHLSNGECGGFQIGFDGGPILDISAYSKDFIAGFQAGEKARQIFFPENTEKLS